MSEADLRAMVREVLRDVLAGRRLPAPATPPQAPARLPAPAPASLAAVEPVAIASDGDLAAFVRRLVALLDDPASGAAVRAGRHRFVLAGGGAAPARAPAPAAAPAAPATPVVLSGAVTETKIAAHAGAGTIVLAPGAVVTPLARDKARALGLKLEARR